MVNDAAVESPSAHTHHATGCRSRGSLAAGIRTWLSCGPVPTTPAAANSAPMPTGRDPGGSPSSPASDGGLAVGATSVDSELSGSEGSSDAAASSSVLSSPLVPGLSALSVWSRLPGLSDSSAFSGEADVEADGVSLGDDVGESPTLAARTVADRRRCRHRHRRCRHPGSLRVGVVRGLGLVGEDGLVPGGDRSALAVSRRTRRATVRDVQAARGLRGVAPVTGLAVRPPQAPVGVGRTAC